MKKLPRHPLLLMFQTIPVNLINPQHELCLLAKKIDRESLEKEFAALFGEVGRSSFPIQTILWLLLVKQTYSSGDETFMDRHIEGAIASLFFRNKIDQLFIVLLSKFLF
ncbi:MAG TPA: hypothetical protein PLC29_07065 [Prolixibacteraceae bacterium]|nr:hypothetical protein [Prolixibacteraceae bacterium]HQB67410.1 hypothetical protein [Prolixibacteraceae bacterium]